MKRSAERQIVSTFEQATLSHYKDGHSWVANNRMNGIDIIEMRLLSTLNSILLSVVPDDRAIAAHSIVRLLTACFASPGQDSIDKFSQALGAMIVFFKVLAANVPKSQLTLQCHVVFMSSLQTRCQALTPADIGSRSYHESNRKLRLVTHGPTIKMCSYLGQE